MVEISTWGVKTDAKGIIFVAAMTALAYVINLVPIPIAPNVNPTFGDIFLIFVACLMGPVWAFFGGAAAISYNALVLWGSPTTVITVGLEFAAMGLLAKKLRPELALVGGRFIGVIIFYIEDVYILGYPMLFVYQIMIDVAITGIVVGAIVMVILRIPSVNRALAMYAPRSYSSYFTKELEAMMESYAE